MITDRQRRRSDLVNYVAVTVLMWFALSGVEGWLAVVAVIATYLVACASEAIVNTGLQLYILAERPKS